MMSRTSTILFALFAAISVSASAAYSQEIKSRRDAVGPAKATLTETLLHNLFPDAKVQWDPVLTIREGSGPSEPVDLGDFTARQLDDGSTGGVAMLEVGSTKAEHIQKLKKFQSADVAHFETTIVAFRIPPSGLGMEIKKISLDPYDRLTKINWFEVQNGCRADGPSCTFDTSLTQRLAILSRFSHRIPWSTWGQAHSRDDYQKACPSFTRTEKRQWNFSRRAVPVQRRLRFLMPARGKQSPTCAAIPVLWTVAHS
jgi:hypothetical protein